MLHITESDILFTVPKSASQLTVNLNPQLYGGMEGRNVTDN
jgi:hypothetical protein